MAFSTRLTRPNQTWALAKYAAFANPLAPTVAELNASAFVSMFSCALTEEGTSMTLGDADSDDTLTFCSIGNESTATYKNPTAAFSVLKEANTGGSGSTVDLTSLYNKAWAWMAFPDISYWVISRTGPNASQDIAFATGQKIKMALFTTDLKVEAPDQTNSARFTQNFLYNGGAIVWNYQIVS
jgi:hypothetical protein